ncbi:MAG: hypothetical protein ACSHW2_09570 [Parasphingopyxis sp.]
MREFTHNMPVNFRANANLVALAEKEARSRSMSLSEFLRAAVRNEVSPPRERADA